MRARHARVLASPEKFGKYELLELVGKGGMAEVFLARASGPKGFARNLAIKRILPHLSDDEEFVDMFVHEAKLSASLTHGVIVPIYEFGEVDGQLFLAMEYVDGTDLRTLLRAKRLASDRLPAAVAVFVAVEMLRALGYAHARTGPEGKLLGLVHRDVSPSNVLLSRGGEVKLCDFGIAKAASRHSSTGSLKGKFSYMSPEQANGKVLDARSDLFSVGVVLWEMLAGTKLFQGDSELSVLDQVRSAQVRELPPLGIAHEKLLRTAVERALQGDKDQRYRDANEFVAALRSFLARSPDVDPAALLREQVEAHAGTERAPDATPGSGVVPTDDAEDSVESLDSVESGDSVDSVSGAVAARSVADDGEAERTTSDVSPLQSAATTPRPAFGPPGDELVPTIEQSLDVVTAVRAADTPREGEDSGSSEDSSSTEPADGSEVGATFEAARTVEVQTPFVAASATSLSAWTRRWPWIVGGAVALVVLVVVVSLLATGPAPTPPPLPLPTVAAPAAPLPPRAVPQPPAPPATATAPVVTGPPTMPPAEPEPPPEPTPPAQPVPSAEPPAAVTTRSTPAPSPSPPPSPSEPRGTAGAASSGPATPAPTTTPDPTTPRPHPRTPVKTVDPFAIGHR